MVMNKAVNSNYCLILFVEKHVGDAGFNQFINYCICFVWNYSYTLYVHEVVYKISNSGIFKTISCKYVIVYLVVFFIQDVVIYFQYVDILHPPTIDYCKTECDTSYANHLIHI